MRPSKFLIIAVLSGGIAFTSCRNNERGIDDDVELNRVDTDADSDLRTTTGTDNNVSTRISENRNLTTFNESMNRNQISQNWDQNNRQGTTTGQGTTGTTGTTTTGTTTTGTTTTGTTTGQETTTGTTTTGTTTDNTQTSSGQAATSVTYTIFAPSNDAYENLTEAQRNEMMDAQNRDRNVASINYLMVEQKLTQDDLRQQIQRANGTHTIRTMQGENITATLDGNDIVLKDASGNEARIIESDSGASDGVVHVIDRVLMPKDPSQNEAARRMNNTGTNTGDRNNTSNNTGNSK